MMLLAGVAEGFVDGVIAATTPTGRAISINPRSGSSRITPTDRAPRRSRNRPIVLRRFFAILSATLPRPVSRTANSASARLRAGSTIAQPAAVAASSACFCDQPSAIACAARARAISLLTDIPLFCRRRLVLGEMSHRQRQRVAAERVAELACHHHFEHGRLAVALRGRGGAKRRTDVGSLFDAQALGAHRLCDSRP